MSSSSSRSPSSRTLSSWSTGSNDSSSSSSSQSTSWSSESSAWDTGSAQAKSYLVQWAVTAKNNQFIARGSIDLRWRDAVIVEARGPLVIDIAGIFNGEVHYCHTAKRFIRKLPQGRVLVESSSSESSVSSGLRAAPYLVSFIDGYSIQETWESLEAAQAWMRAIETRLQAAMAVLRALYQQYPATFDQRTRTV